MLPLFIRRKSIGFLSVFKVLNVSKTGLFLIRDFIS